MCTYSNQVRRTLTSQVSIATHVFECLVLFYTIITGQLMLAINGKSPSSFFFLTFVLVIWEAWACKIGDSRLIFPFAKLVFFWWPTQLCRVLPGLASLVDRLGKKIVFLESCFSFSCLADGDFLSFVEGFAGRVFFWSSNSPAVILMLLKL